MPRRASHPDPVVRDFQAIRRLRWSQPTDFAELEVLLTHPVVVALAKGSPEASRRVRALRTVLERTVSRVRRQERAGDAPEGRSVATAAARLLRLEPEFEDLSVEEIRRRIAMEWPSRRKGGVVSGDGFRLHLEVKEVLEPFAGAFRAYVRERAAKQGIELSEAHGPSPGAGDAATAATEPGLGQIARRLWKLEEDLHRRRLASIRDGMLRIRNEEEMLDVLALFTETAERELTAVDHIDISEWFGNTRLRDYLDRQLDRARREEVRIERIRLVSDSELEVPPRRRQLAQFVKLHDEASAALLLCPLDVASELRTSFTPRMGLLFADPETEPVAITGWLGEGLIERAMVYTRETEALRELRDDYTRIRTSVISREHDRALRNRLRKLNGPRR
jgi:hypothetical protein